MHDGRNSENVLLACHFALFGEPALMTDRPIVNVVIINKATSQDEAKKYG